MTEEQESETLWALVRRHPRGGYAVVIGLLSFDSIPAVDGDKDDSFITMAAAEKFARDAGFWSIHPECFRAPTRLIQGAFR